MRSKILPRHLDREVRSIISRAVDLRAPASTRLPEDRLAEIARTYPAFGRLGELLAIAEELRHS